MQPESADAHSGSPDQGVDSADDAATEIRIGISACVLGEPVRYDGGHKLDRFLRDTVGTFVRFVPVCPEVDIGLGVPRETLRLVRDNGALRMIAAASGSDRTALMQHYARRRVRELAALNLCGYVLKKGSPSCGMERVKVYGARGVAKPDGRGLFAAELMSALPLLPVEEEGRLNDPVLRENFFERVFAYRRLRQLFQRSWRIHDLIAFHAREKLLILAHDRPTYEALGRLVADAKGTPRTQLARQYEQRLMTGLQRIATPRKHVNVLQHMAGYLRNQLDEEQRAELHEVIDHYRNQWVPLIVPITLLRHHVQRHRVAYLQQQSYLNPHPRELMLRNHV